MKNNQIARIIDAALAIQPIADRKAELAISMPWDAPVFASQLLTPRGTPSGFFGVIAKLENDRELVVGQYRKGEVLTSNASLCERVETALGVLGWDWTRKESMSRDGSGFTATYDILTSIPGMEFLIHSPIIPQIKVHNSYDGKDKKSLEFAMKLLVCLNGAENLLSGASMAIKHSRESLEKFGLSIQGVLEAGKRELPSLSLLADMPLDDELACNFFANVAAASSSKGAISEKTALTMLGHYFAPDENEAKLAPSIWRAYMAGTRAMRDLREVRPTQADLANRALGKAVSFALSQTKEGSIFLHGHRSPYAALVAKPARPLFVDKMPVQIIEVEIA